MQRRSKGWDEQSKYVDRPSYWSSSRARGQGANRGRRDTRPVFRCGSPHPRQPSGELGVRRSSCELRGPLPPSTCRPVFSLPLPLGATLPLPPRQWQPSVQASPGHGPTLSCPQGGLLLGPPASSACLWSHSWGSHWTPGVLVWPGSGALAPGPLRVGLGGVLSCCLNPTSPWAGCILRPSTGAAFVSPDLPSCELRRLEPLVVEWRV